MNIFPTGFFIFIWKVFNETAGYLQLIVHVVISEEGY